MSAPPEARKGPPDSGPIPSESDHQATGIDSNDSEDQRPSARSVPNYGMALFPQHAEMLAASGISVEHARARGYRSQDTKAQLRDLGITRAGCLVPGLLIPQRRRDGSVWGHQYRPDNPRMRNGKVAKYETPTGQRSGIDVPPGLADRLGDPTVDLWVTEGVKKADSAVVAGLTCIALPGVWAWRGTNRAGGKTAVADWHDVALNGRIVVLCFDSDVTVKPPVHHALTELARYLESKGAEIRYCHLPNYGDGKTGLDDYLAEHTVAELLDLVHPEAPVSDQPDEADVDLWPAPTAPLDVARRIVADYTEDDMLTLRHWRGGWIRWDRDHWIEAEDKEIRSWIYSRLEHASYWNGKASEPWRPKARSVSDVLDALIGITLLPERIDAPYWLPDGEPVSGVPADEIVACTNELLHVVTRKSLPLTPALFNRVAVPFDYQPDAPAPAAWLEFMDALWPDDPASVQLLQEWFGYVLSGRTDLHKILLMIGPTRSGKGTIARVLSALIGRGNVAGPTLASMATNFGLSPLLGRPLAIVSDARLGGGNAFQVVERLLSISGEDMLTVDRKYREPWTGKLPARLMILSNELPRFGDASGAIANRFVVLTMMQSFLGKEDHHLTNKLLTELPGILRWSLDGLDRVVTSDQFTVSDASEATIVAMHDLVSPMSAFVRDRCKRNPSGDVAVATLFAAWTAWCEDNGRDHTGTVQSFGRDLMAVVPGVRVTQPTVDNQRVRHYCGLTLRPDPDNGSDRVQSRAGNVFDQAAARTGTREKPLWRLCVLQNCQHAVVPGTQFCANHASGTTGGRP